MTLPLAPRRLGSGFRGRSVLGNGPRNDGDKLATVFFKLGLKIDNSGISGAQLRPIEGKFFHQQV